MTLIPDNEEERLRSVAIQNAQSILAARQRAEKDLLAANDALEARTAELERANELILTIAENAASSLLMLDEQGVVTYMNSAATEETGYTLDQFSGQPFHDVLHAPRNRGGHSRDECPIRNARERVLPLKKHRDVFIRKDGRTFPVSCSLSPLQREGQPAGAVLEFRDVTDELVAQKALEDANRRKDEFLATLSHELRTPMTSVLGWARMLKLGLSERESREAVEAIERSAVMQAQLIDDVLDVSRIVAGKMTFHPVPVDVAPVLQAAMTTVHPAVAAKGIEIHADVPAELPRILGDEGRLQQIIWNLLSNAVKFTTKGGKIAVKVAHIGSILRLVVEDSGKGIDPAYLPHIFEPFSQEDATRTRSHEGIGLGLSIVRSLVELHGGRIRVASEGAGRGAKFVVEIPIIESYAWPENLERKPANATVSADQTSLPDLRGVRVLAIDDQENTRDLLRSIFMHAGADMRLASSVRQGIALLNEAPPDVVICDLAMPEEDGFAFIQALRAMLPPVNATPVIALTAFGRSEDRLLALRAGFNEYITKPVDPEQLTTIVLSFKRRAS